VEGENLLELLATTNRVATSLLGEIMSPIPLSIYHLMDDVLIIKKPPQEGAA